MPVSTNPKSRLPFPLKYRLSFITNEEVFSEKAVMYKVACGSIKSSDLSFAVIIYLLDRGVSSFQTDFVRSVGIDPTDAYSLTSPSIGYRLIIRSSDFSGENV